MAGNRVNTYWRMRLSFSGSNFTRGAFEPVEVNNVRWLGNVFGMVSTLERAISSVGGKKGNWPKP